MHSGASGNFRRSLPPREKQPTPYVAAWALSDSLAMGWDIFFVASIAPFNGADKPSHLESTKPNPAAAARDRIPGTYEEGCNE